MIAMKEMNLDSLRPLQGFGVDETKLVNASLRLDEGKCQDFRFKHTFQTIEAAEQLGRLPETGESLHLVLKGNFALFALIPAVIRLNSNRPIERLRIATLGFSRKNVDELSSLAQAGLVKAASMLSSHYHAAVDAPIYEHFRATLPQFPVVAMRSHAKILLIETTGTFLTVESSANLRSCKNIEQATVTNDPGLHQHHAEWIDAMIAKGLSKRRKAGAE
jgi:hypothetical protein